jgi:hypothetical protein
MDEADRAGPEVERYLAEAIRQNSRELAPGKPGECDLCGQHSMRLVDGACAPCRDKHKLP